MTLYKQIITAYPELTNDDFGDRGTINLQDDSDGVGAYIKSWNYFKPIPDGLTLGKPK